CQFERLGKALYVRDLNSRNGTMLRGEPVKRSRLEVSDEVTCGKTSVVFEGIEEEGGAARLGRGTIPIFQRMGKRKRALRNAEDENRKLRQLLLITRQIVEELDPDKVLSRIIDTAVDLAAAERGFLLVFRDDDLSVEVARNYWRKDVSDPELEISRHLATRVREERRGIIVEDASEDERFSEFLSVHALQLRSVLCVPLLFRGEVRGVLYLDNRFTRGSFREDDRDVLESFADLAAIALENSGRFTAERVKKQDLEERVRRGRDELIQVRRALAAREQNDRLRYSYESLVAESPPMKALLGQVDRVIPTDLPIVLQGPAGTGKERLARIIHESGPRTERPFMALACAALPASLAEVELFGHARGAYTGAGDASGGILESTEGGTLYLDNADDLDIETQALFLRVLESGEYRRVGENETRRADVRVIVGTRGALDQLVVAGGFREDLYFRLKGVTLRLPVLADRPEDLPLLLERIMKEEAPKLNLTPRARKALLLRPWPGNLLELRNEVRRLATLGDEPVDVDQLGPVDPGADVPLKQAVSDLERRMIARALRLHEGNLTKTAEALGLSRLGLRKKLERYEIER
ncbi:MAG: sigma 54-interacting transcriptional regulator, partial [Planctomycetes bacterium]|nr:sigma 54-interacting transcriptional regulator [Planctomycetota bacterium]